jgi:hypothetical protein
MKGTPNSINTESDIITCIEVDPVKAKRVLNNLLYDKDKWFKTTALSSYGEGIVDDTHQVHEEYDELNPNITPKYFQYEKKEDPRARMFQIGLTVAKVNKYIKDCDKKIS